MNECKTAGERKALRAFYRGGADVLLNAALEGRCGRCFISGDGASVLTVSRGFVFPAGQAREGFFREAAKELPPGFLTFSGTPAWRQIIFRWGARTRMTRRDMANPPAFDEAHLSALSALPAGFEMRLGGENDYAQCLSRPWSEDLCSFYPDASAFAADGLMAGAYRDGQLVSGCGAYARTKDAVEIEIDTDPAFRRRGLALACAARFLLLCRERGLRPHWDAMTPQSARLARKLGFLPGRAYPVVCRE